MKTASFFTYGGLGRISIARWAPRKTPAGFCIYKALAPGEWFNKVTRPEYERLYADQLGLLDPETVWNELHTLADGNEPVLLCWERPPFTETNWCHRRLVARWFEQALGVEVPELARKSGVPVDLGGGFQIGCPQRRQEPLTRTFHGDTDRQHLLTRRD